MRIKTKRLILSPTDQELRDEHYYRRLWMIFRSLDISSRDWLDYIANTIYFFDGVILNPDGSLWKILEVDDEITYRTIQNLKKADRDGLPLHKPRNIEAIRLIDVTLRIDKPKLHRHCWR